MRYAKLFQWVALFLIVVATLTGAPAIAWGGGSYKLTCVVPAGDPDYGASSVAKLGNRTFLYYSPYYGGADVYTAEVSVACSGLTHGRTYRVVANSWPVGQQLVAEFSADARGDGSAVGGIVVYKTRLYKWSAVRVDVYRDDGTLVFTGVL